jgi:hypothetical protein
LTHWKIFCGKDIPCLLRPCVIDRCFSCFWSCLWRTVLQCPCPLITIQLPVNFPSLWQNTWGKSICKEESLLTILEVSVHDHLAPLPWACVKAVHHGKAV